jgi:hypothetical protein
MKNAWASMLLRRGSSDACRAVSMCLVFLSQPASSSADSGPGENLGPFAFDVGNMRSSLLTRRLLIARPSPPRRRTNTVTGRPLGRRVVVGGLEIPFRFEISGDGRRSAAGSSTAPKVRPRRKFENGRWSSTSTTTRLAEASPEHPWQAPQSRRGSTRSTPALRAIAGVSNEVPASDGVWQIAA